MQSLNPKWIPQRLQFDCPKCRTHRITIPFGPGMWTCIGNSLERLSVNPSYLQLVGCKVHLTIVNSEVEFKE